jgi:hypothetical protein
MNGAAIRSCQARFFDETRLTVTLTTWSGCQSTPCGTLLQDDRLSAGQDQSEPKQPTDQEQRIDAAGAGGPFEIAVGPR